jgi:hypothetical protein
MKRSILWAGLVAAMAALNAGCLGRLVNEGAGIVVGAKANVVEIDPLDLSQQIGPVKVEKIENAMGQPVSGEWLFDLAGSLRLKLANDAVFLEPGRRAVKVSGVVVHVEGAKLMDQAFGPHPEVVVRVTAKDAVTGRVIGMANVVGRARGDTSSSRQDLSDAFASGVAKWLHTPDKRRRD